MTKLTDLLVTNNYHSDIDATTVEVKADFCTTIVKRTSEGVILDVYDVNGELLHTQIFLADDYDVDKNWEESK